jgi:hypothetical protein
VEIVLTDPMAVTVAVATPLVPTIAVLVVILRNRSESKRLNELLTNLESNLRTEMQLESASLRLEQQQVRGMLVTTVINHASRIGKLEGKAE